MLSTKVIATSLTLAAAALLATVVYAQPPNRYEYQYPNCTGHGLGDSVSASWDCPNPIHLLTVSNGPDSFSVGSPIPTKQWYKIVTSGYTARHSATTKCTWSTVSKSQYCRCCRSSWLVAPSVSDVSDNIYNLDDTPPNS